MGIDIMNSQNDITERLTYIRDYVGNSDFDSWLEEAAAEISRLRSLVAEQDQQIDDLECALGKLRDAEHVGWMRYGKVRDHETTLHVCDSDAPGAFKVYRRGE